MEGANVARESEGTEIEFLLTEDVDDESLLGCLPFVRINRLGRPLNNGESFSKISKPTERNAAYHL